MGSESVCATTLARDTSVEIGVFCGRTTGRSGQCYIETVLVSNVGLTFRLCTHTLQTAEDRAECTEMTNEYVWCSACVRYR